MAIIRTADLTPNIGQDLGELKNTFLTDDTLTQSPGALARALGFDVAASGDIIDKMVLGERIEELVAFSKTDTAIVTKEEQAALETNLRAVHQKVMDDQTQSAEAILNHYDGLVSNDAISHTEKLGFVHVPFLGGFEESLGRHVDSLHELFDAMKLYLDRSNTLRLEDVGIAVDRIGEQVIKEQAASASLAPVGPSSVPVGDQIVADFLTHIEDINLSPYEWIGLVHFGKKALELMPPADQNRLDSEIEQAVQRIREGLEGVLSGGTYNGRPLEKDDRQAMEKALTLVNWLESHVDTHARRIDFHDKRTAAIDYIQIERPLMQDAQSVATTPADEQTVREAKYRLLRIDPTRIFDREYEEESGDKIPLRQKIEDMSVELKQEAATHSAAAPDRAAFYDEYRATVDQVSKELSKGLPKVKVKIGRVGDKFTPNSKVLKFFDGCGRFLLWGGEVAAGGFLSNVAFNLLLEPRFRLNFADGSTAVSNTGIALGFVIPVTAALLTPKLIGWAWKKFSKN